MSRTRIALIVIFAVTITFSNDVLAYDPTHGATHFVFVPAGQLWHPIGPAKLITIWDGPYGNYAGHPPNIYMMFTKTPSRSSPSTKPLPKNLRTYHMLGTSFYYPAAATPGPTPARLGYTAIGFVTADRLVSAFPHIEPLFPSGLRVASCHSSRYNYFLLLGNGMDAAYLIVWKANYVADLAYMPSKWLKHSLDSVLDHVSYYENGGMYEIMRFGALYYYLSRVPQLHRLSLTSTLPQCPKTPTATRSGMHVPQSWVKALRDLQ